MMSGNRRHAEVPRLFLLISLEMSCCQRNLQGREGRHHRGVCRWGHDRWVCRVERGAPTEESARARGGHNRVICRVERRAPTEESEGARGGHRVICRVDTTEESAGARGGHNRVICRRRGGDKTEASGSGFFLSLCWKHMYAQSNRVCMCMWESGGIAVAWAPIPLTAIKGVWALFNISHILWKSLHTATDNLESLRNVARVSQNGHVMWKQNQGIFTFCSFYKIA